MAPRATKCSAQGRPWHRSRRIFPSRFDGDGDYSDRPREPGGVSCGSCGALQGAPRRSLCDAALQGHSAADVAMQGGGFRCSRIGASRDCNQSYWRQQRCAYLWKTASSVAGVCYVEAARITPRHSGARICAKHSMLASRGISREQRAETAATSTVRVWSALRGDTTTLKLRRQGMSASTSPFTRSKVSSARCSLVSRLECGRRCGPRARVYLGASAGWLWRARAVKVVRAAWVTEAAYCVYLPPSSFTITR